MNINGLRSTPFELTVRMGTRFDFDRLGHAIHTEDNLYTSHFFNALSLMTPITEGILIRAIREALASLKGAVLEKDAVAFIGQEAVHTREHRAFNRRLATLGFDTQEIIDEIGAEVKKLEGSMTLQERLALVVTGEHVIYSLARALLVSDYKKSSQHKEVERLFVWHALEEVEHQSVCDDIYGHVYGRGIKQRLLYYRIFGVASKLLLRGVSKLMRRLVEQSRKPEKGEFRAFILWLFSNPGVGCITIREGLTFFVPNFKQWNRSEEDITLIKQNLAMIYEGATE